MRIRWAQRCTAHRSNGQPCSAFAVTGGLVCVAHGGRAPQVRAAAARRWEFELMMRRMACRYGDPLALAWVRAQFPTDPATYRRHRAKDDPTPWTPRSIPVNLDELMREHGRAAG
jgi:hypothetical protein